MSLFWCLFVFFFQVWPPKGAAYVVYFTFSPETHTETNEKEKKRLETFKIFTDASASIRLCPVYELKVK